MVLNWPEERPPQGKLYFANNTMAVQCHLYQGLADLPSLEWTHLLVSMANHAPYVVRRETLGQAGGNLVATMPDPTFQAQVKAPGHSVVGVQLVVDYPWVKPATWPAALREAFPIPSAVRLEIDAQTQSTYFVGAPDTATTVRSKGQLLIETAEGLKKSIAYPADSLDKVIVLTAYPRLTLRIDPGQLNPLPQGYDIGIRFRADGVEDHQATQVYGLTVSCGESTEGWASYVFNGTPDPQDLTTVRVAGVFQVTKKAALVILAQKPGFVEASVAWPFGQQSHEISLHAARKLTVQILNAPVSRSDQKIYLTDGTNRWGGNRRSQGVYEFEAVPKGELRTKLADDESTQEWVVPADTSSFTLPLGG